MKAMILAAGRGERMRPLTDHTPKPLLSVGGQPLIVRQIEKLAHAGFTDLVINHAWLGAMIRAELGNGARWGVSITYSDEGNEPLETAGGIALALPRLRDRGRECAFACVSADIFCDYDYTRLIPHIEALPYRSRPGLFLVMVPNPDFHREGDFSLDDHGMLSLHGTKRYTFGNIGVYDTRMFADLTPGVFMRMRPFYERAIADGDASGELFIGRWENIGTPAQLRALDASLGNA